MKALQPRKIRITGGESATVLRRKKRERQKLFRCAECWPVKGLTACYYTPVDLRARLVFPVYVL